MRRYTVLLFREEGIYSALVPVLNLATQGDTVEHALEMAHEAIALRLSSLLENDEFVPEEESAPLVATVEIASPVQAVA
jgi:predicted RNase H-like HicB family nuclease